MNVRLWRRNGEGQDADAPRGLCLMSRAMKILERKPQFFETEAAMTKKDEAERLLLFYACV
jgi:hypothetical protein